MQGHKNSKKEMGIFAADLELIRISLAGHNMMKGNFKGDECSMDLIMVSQADHCSYIYC